MKGKKKLLLTFICLILAIIFLFPILILLFNSLKPIKEIYQSVLALPKTFSLDNYIDAFRELDYFTSIRNSFIVTGGVTADKCSILLYGDLGFGKVSNENKPSDIWDVFCCRISPVSVCHAPAIKINGKFTYG